MNNSMKGRQKLFGTRRSIKKAKENLNRTWASKEIDFSVGSDFAFSFVPVKNV